MNDYYLKSEAERIIHDLGYECDEHDIETVAKMFDENYNSFFPEYQIWWDVIDKYYAMKYGEK